MNIAQVLKAEISRISKHEAKLLTSSTRSGATQNKTCMQNHFFKVARY
jgi:hypothetical protein